MQSSIWSAAESTRAALTAARAELRGRIDFEWYRYDSFSNLAALRPLLGSRHDAVLNAALREGVIDLGCGDGDLSFLFRSLGCRVTAVDYPPANHNAMQGVYALRRALQSDIDIREVDLDAQFNLPGERYGLAIFLGALYHLKNPFYALEKVARHCRYCILSTRVARCFSNGKPMPPGEAIAYFLDADELNNDNSNYWILSIPALRRMVKRASWTTLNEVDMGDTSKSRPNTLNHDERLFLLLESRCGTAQVELLDGWWHAEETGWRWTRQQFSARVNCDRPSPKLVIDTYIAPVLIEKFETVTLSLTVDGVPLAPARFTASGDHTVTRELPSGSAERVVSFSLAHVMREQAEDARELGIIVTALRVD